jgi:hypothetical protein
VFLLAARLLSRKRLAVVIGNLTKSSETSEQNLASNAQGEKAGC